MWPFGGRFRTPRRGTALSHNTTLTGGKQLSVSGYATSSDHTTAPQPSCRDRAWQPRGPFGGGVCLTYVSKLPFLTKIESSGVLLEQEGKVSSTGLAVLSRRPWPFVGLGAKII